MASILWNEQGNPSAGALAEVHVEQIWGLALFFARAKRQSKSMSERKESLIFQRRASIHWAFFWVQLRILWKLWGLNRVTLEDEGN